MEELLKFISVESIQYRYRIKLSIAHHYCDNTMDLITNKPNPLKVSSQQNPTLANNTDSGEKDGLFSNSKKVVVVEELTEYVVKNLEDLNYLLRRKEESETANAFVYGHNIHSRSHQIYTIKVRVTLTLMFISINAVNCR